MPVSSENSITGPYFPNGATKSFAFDFKATAANEVVALDQSGATISTALYSVTLDEDEGGTLTFATAPLLSDYAEIYVVGNPSLTQPSDFDNSGPSFNPAAVTRAFDRAAARDLKQQREIDRGLKVPFGEAAPPLPSIESLKGRFTAVDLDGNFFGSYGTGADGGLREDLADGPALSLIKGGPGYASARAEMDSKGPVATKSTAIDANPYPVDFRLGRDHAPHPFEFVPAVRHNAIIAQNSTYDCAPDLQAMHDGWNPDTGSAGVIPFPSGRFMLGSEVRFPNWISWQGFGRCTMIVPLPDFTIPSTPGIPTSMLRFDSDPAKTGSPTSQFENRLMNLDIDGNSFTGLDAMIYAPSWNEKSGLYNVLMRRTGCTALLANEFHGGSAGWAIEHCEFMFTTDATVGLRLLGRTRAGGFIGNRPQINMHNNSIVGPVEPAADSTEGFTSIQVDNLILNSRGGNHIEKAFVALDVANNGDLTGVGWTGSDNGGRVRYMVGRAVSHTGQIDVDGIDLGTATGANALLDSKVGMTQTLPIGKRIQVPSLPGTPWADGRFKVSGSAVTESQLRGCSAVIRDGATGFFKVTHSNSFASGDQYYVVAQAHDENVRLRVDTWISERVGGTVHLRVYRTTDNTLFDPAEVTFQIYRKPGL